MTKEVRDYAIVLAIDDKERARAVALASEVGPLVDAIKLGVPTLITNGVSIVRDLKSVYQGPLIADLKVADIGFKASGAKEWSGTNRSIVEAAVSGGVDYVICHTIVGTTSIQECVDTAHAMGGRVLTLPNMTQTSAGLFFDNALDEEGEARLSKLGFSGVVTRVQKLRKKKLTEAGWRSRKVSVSDLILLLGEEIGVDGYVAPANKPEVMKDYRRITLRRIFATGVARQGGKLGDVYSILGRNSAAIVGHEITASADPVVACRRLIGERETAMAGGKP
ncbi:MAG TPA: orotidine 5'-phosphate decarboxylase / HUMPS family protein [Nitrososphaerales archaeon]|nr:orotidine 5'-phosphate decarboxylase / HUMPS family protein [Nitrososphaerales archaeon]